MIHMFQQNLDFDLFSVVAIKAFYKRNRDLAMKKLKAECPEFYSSLLDKHNSSSNAFFFGLAQGVKKFAQAEGGKPGATEMSFLYELCVNKLVNSVADVLHDGAPGERESLVGTFMTYIGQLLLISW